MKRIVIQNDLKTTPTQVISVPCKQN
ncbi:BnaAnng31000D [Brassica napus]|uniref:BnaAnng31000D protein n=1 Tax=Brassica napus TaxID=3708 RepID=A0A078JT58_BRANA|nr:BnaAnng31000D [Brassica napus]